jgi:hypothetical protein
MVVPEKENGDLVAFCSQTVLQGNNGERNILLSFQMPV